MSKANSGIRYLQEIKNMESPVQSNTEATSNALSQNIPVMGDSLLLDICDPAEQRSISARVHHDDRFNRQQLFDDWLLIPSNDFDLIADGDILTSIADEYNAASTHISSNTDLQASMEAIIYGPTVLTVPADTIMHVIYQGPARQLRKAELSSSLGIESLVETRSSPQLSLQRVCEAFGIHTATSSDRDWAFSEGFQATPHERLVHRAGESAEKSGNTPETRIWDEIEKDELFKTMMNGSSEHTNN